jgi:DNA-binding response OmpR family regulator
VFTVRLPARASAAAGAVRPAFLPDTAAPFVEEALGWTAEAPAAGTRADPDAPSILLVEDNPDMSAYLARLLSGEGWRVRATGDGASALRAAEADPPDLMLSDVMLPGRDGIAVLREMRASARLSRIPIILLTARAGSESAVEGLRQGADDYIVKPFVPAELLARVRVHLQMTQLRELVLARSERRSGNLEQALTSRTVISQAVGVVMAQQRCSPEQAFALLSRASQNRNVKLQVLAREVVGRFTEDADPPGPAR